MSVLTWTAMFTKLDITFHSLLVIREQIDTDLDTILDTS